MNVNHRMIRLTALRATTGFCRIFTAELSSPDFVICTDKTKLFDYEMVAPAEPSFAEWKYADMDGPVLECGWFMAYESAYVIRSLPE